MCIYILRFDRLKYVAFILFFIYYYYNRKICGTYDPKLKAKMIDNVTSRNLKSPRNRVAQLMG